ncbi:NAD(P)-binding domain-containing protein [Xylophilus sp. ASV27]|uniref:NAD(P)-binding domain-containing protein n=1 Tax=Xylophilus sp. ASV27 TaxID=2795129 RepID=UPI0018EB9020|nr:NAD(P)-binding domain-containing protein [Xylophilus sp. ASV27]
MKTAILGGGVVGLCYAQALADAGHTLSGICDPQPAAALQTFAQVHGLAIHPAPGPWLDDAELVISAVFGTLALEVMRAALPHLRSGALYVDMSTADPADMREAEALAHARGQRFADVAITGAVNLSGARTPLLCAGDGATQAAQVLAACGAPVRVVGSRAGDAVSLKLLRSIFTKGMEALAVECLLTAESKGLRQELHAVLSDIDEGCLRETMESMVRTHIAHAPRRLNEVIEAQRQMRLTGVEPVVLPGVQQRFEKTVAMLSARAFDGGNTAAALAWLAAPDKA